MKAEIVEEVITNKKVVLELSVEEATTLRTLLYYIEVGAKSIMSRTLQDAGLTPDLGLGLEPARKVYVDFGKNIVNN